MKHAVAVIPALFTRMSIGPKAAAAANIDFDFVRSDTSAQAAMADPPDFDDLLGDLMGIALDRLADHNLGPSRASLALRPFP